MSEKVKVGLHGHVVIPKRLRKKYNLEEGIIIEISETNDGLLLKPFNPVADMKGLGEGVFGDPIKYQKRIREDWECKH